MVLHYENLKKNTERQISNKHIQPPLISQKEKKLMYKTSLCLYGNHAPYLYSVK